MAGIQLIRTWYANATETERQLLAPLYDSLHSISPHISDHVQHAEILATIEQYDYQSWPSDFQLSDNTNLLQRFVTGATEFRQVDHVQRSNYFQLLSGGRNRHHDVALGLSGKLLWNDRQVVTQALIQMGKRQYTAPVPQTHESENGVLHVAVSYKHAARFNQGGTISPTVAEAIWSAINGLLTLYDATEESYVRVWIDQNLHRTKLPKETQWHEYGLLPYACLKVVVVGDGNQGTILGLAQSRPWLWVEALAALRGSGIHFIPGYNILDGAADLFATDRKYDLAKQPFTKFGYILGANNGTDAVMNETTRTISLWRRDFLQHGGYEYAEDFELFVNWARWFVIRKKNYSEMAQNHSSRPVIGADAMLLIRSLPTVFWDIESKAALLSPRVMWTLRDETAMWTVGDIIDRSLIGKIPLKTIIETHQTTSEDGHDILLVDKSCMNIAIKIRKHGRTVKLISDEHIPFSMSFIYRRKFRATRQLIHSHPLVTWQFPQQNDKIVITYRPFTSRFNILRQTYRMPLGDAVVLPQKLSVAVCEKYHLKWVAYCYNDGVGELVYEVAIDDDTRQPFSTTEIRVLLYASRGCLEAFRNLARAIKHNCEYKSMLYEDMNPTERRERSRGWHINSCDMRNSYIVSGELDDIDRELEEKLKGHYKGRTFLRIDEFPMALNYKKVQMIYSNSRGSTRIIVDKTGPPNSLAILGETDVSKLVNERGTGLLQLLCSFRPGDIVPLTHFNENNSDQGIFVLCRRCKNHICLVNGLSVQFQRKDRVEYVIWGEWHKCSDPIFEESIIANVR